MEVCVAGPFRDKGVGRKPTQPLTPKGGLRAITIAMLFTQWKYVRLIPLGIKGRGWKVSYKNNVY